MKTLKFAHDCPCVNLSLSADYTSASLVTADLFHWSSCCALMKEVWESSPVLMIGVACIAMFPYKCQINKYTYINTHAFSLNTLALNKHRHSPVKFDINGHRGQMRLATTITLFCASFLISWASLHYLWVTPKHMKNNSCSRSPNRN